MLVLYTKISSEGYQSLWGECYSDLLMSSLLVLVGRYSLCLFWELREAGFFWCAIFTHKMVVNDMVAASFDSSEEQLDLE